MTCQVGNLEYELQQWQEHQQQPAQDGAERTATKAGVTAQLGPKQHSRVKHFAFSWESDRLIGPHPEICLYTSACM